MFLVAPGREPAISFYKSFGGVREFRTGTFVPPQRPVRANERLVDLIAALRAEQENGHAMPRRRQRPTRRKQRSVGSVAPSAPSRSSARVGANKARGKHPILASRPMCPRMCRPSPRPRRVERANRASTRRRRPTPIIGGDESPAGKVIHGSCAFAVGSATARRPCTGTRLHGVPVEGTYR